MLSKLNQRFKKSDIVILSILILAVVLRIIWAVYTNFTYEDAFITFQYARRISQGSGFVYNLGEKICGTTTPFFTLLLTLWMWIFGEGSVIIGAKLITLTASVTSLIFILLSLRSLDYSPLQQVFALSFLVLWPKLWQVDTGGMETSLILFFIASSWYTYLTKKSLWTGILLGLMLWTRIDTIAWAVLISGFELFRNPKELIKIFAATIITIAPWIIFSWTYFGSPIPYTIIAKQIAYSKFNSGPYHQHFYSLIKRFGPVSSITYPGKFSGLAAIFTILVLLLAAFQSYIARKDRSILLLSLFSFSEIVILTFTKATFASRYVIPSLSVILLLAGLFIGHIWEKINNQPLLKYLFILTAVGGVVYLLSIGVSEASIARQAQKYINQESLMSIGEWLNENTEQDATVQLEPLGFAGYYANRRMLEVVGLITPAVVDQKNQGIHDPYEYIPILEPDYLVVHCDDILRWLEKDEDNHYLTEFTKLATFNPLNFDPTFTDIELSIEYILSRSACYEIWGSH